MILSNSSPSPDSEAPNEPHILYLRQYYTESVYKKATLHNRLRWTLNMGLGIPVFVFLLTIFGIWLTLLLSFAFFPGIYALGTALFPGSKNHGTVLYDRYRSQQAVVIEAFKSCSLYRKRQVNCVSPTLT